MMNGFDARDIDILDEEYFGPPPRVLVEDRSPFERIEQSRFGDGEALPSLQRLKQLLGGW
jgi:hypothetical protein